jgi:hypothetical protein
MAFITLNQPIIWPGNTLAMQGATPSSAAFDTIDSNGGVAGAADATAFVVCAPKDLAISHLFLKCTAATGSATCIGSIVTVDPATGFPTTTPWATNTSEYVQQCVKRQARRAVPATVRLLRLGLSLSDRDGDRRFQSLHSRQQQRRAQFERHVV